MTWFLAAPFIVIAIYIVATVVCIFGLAVLHGYRINSELEEMIAERKAAREEARRMERMAALYEEGLRERAEARRIAREHEELRHAAK